MATVNLGRVGLVLKGEYDASTKYEKLDVVTYQGSSYIAKQTTTGNAPTNESFWQLQSEKGEKGDKGDAGGGLTRLDDQTPVTVDGVLAGKNGKLAPADFVPAEILPTNTVAQAGIVAAPTANNANSLWSTDGSGNPAWRYYDYQTKSQIQQLIAEAISESGHASFEKIDHIPTVEEAKDNILYLVYNTKTEHYDIYAKVGDEVLLIDDTTVDLSDYVTNEALAAKDYATNTALNAATTEISTNLNNKVDKEPGKGLSSNDYTADDKSKLAGIEASADVNKIESVKLNGTALPIDTQKAVNIDLSGYATDNELSTGLSGKVDKENGKQLSTEDFTTAYKNKLDGIPEGGGGGEVNIINTVKVNGTPLVPDAEKAVDIKAYNEDNKPEVGGRNLLLNSGVRVTNSEYLIKEYIISDKTLKDGEKVTVTLKGTLGSGKSTFALYNTDSVYLIFTLLDKGNGYYQFTGSWMHSEIGNRFLQVYIFPREISTESTIEWIKLERGEIATDWTPAPEDLEAKIPISTSQLTNDSGFITSNDIPEGAAASNTVPKAPAATGSVGNELAFARGDHVHPIGTVSVDNVSGILPIEKGGTGNIYGHPYEFFDNAYVAMGRTAIAIASAVMRNTANENDLMAVTGAFANNYCVRACLGVGEYYYDLGNNIAIQQNATDKTIIGTYKGREIATLTDYATATTAGLVKPGTNCSVGSDGTLNVSVPTVNVPTKVSELQNDSGYIGSNGGTINGNKYLNFGDSAGTSTNGCGSIRWNQSNTSLSIRPSVPPGVSSEPIIELDGTTVAYTLRGSMSNSVDYQYTKRNDYATSNYGGTVKVGSGLSISSGTLSTTAEPYNGPKFSQAFSKIIVISHITLPSDLASGNITIDGFDIINGYADSFSITQTSFFTSATCTYTCSNPNGIWATDGGFYINTLSSYGPLDANKGRFSIAVTIPSIQQNTSSKWTSCTEFASYLERPQGVMLQASGCLCIY